MVFRSGYLFLLFSVVLPQAIKLNASAEGPQKPLLDPQQIADDVARSCSALPNPIFDLAVEGLIASTISNDGKTVAYATSQAIHTVVLADGKTKRVAVELSAPAQLRLLGGEAAIAIWMPSKFLLLDLRTEKIITTLKPKPEEGRFIDWAVSPSGFQVVLVAGNGNRYVVDLSTGKGNGYVEKNPKDREGTSQAISDNGLRLVTSLDKGSVDITYRELEPPKDTGSFQEREFVPGSMKLAASDSNLAIVYKNALIIYPMPIGGDPNQAPLTLSGDFVCFFAQMGRRGQEDILLAVLRSQLTDDMMMANVDIKTNRVSRIWKLPEADPFDVRWSLSGDRVCYSTSDSVYVIDAPALNQSRSLEPVAEISKRLIDSRDFKTMDQVADLLFDNYQEPVRPFDRWYGSLSTQIMDDTLEQEELPELIKQWLKERPRSELARLMGAHWHRMKGWSVRGDGFVQGRTEEQLNSFRDHFVEAYEILGVVNKRKISVLALETALEISKALGPSALDRQALVDKLTEEYPWYVAGHSRVVEMLMPRWGGTVDQLTDYIDRASKLQHEDERDKMYALLVLNLFPYFKTDELFETFDFDLDQIVRGAQKIDLRKGLGGQGYRRLMVELGKQDRSQDLHDLLKHHTSCTPFFVQEFGRQRDTVLYLWRDILESKIVSVDKLNAATLLEKESRKRRTSPRKKKED